MFQMNLLISDIFIYLTFGNLAILEQFSEKLK